MSSPSEPLVGSAPDGLFASLGRFAVRRRWWIVAAWLAILAVAIPIAPNVVGALRAGGFILDDLESARAKALLQAELDAPPSAIVVVYHSDTLTAGSPEFEAAAAEAIRDVPSAPYVVRVFPHTLAPRQVSADGRTAYDVVFLSIAPDDSPAALPGIVERLAHPPGISVEVAGGPAFYGDVQSRVGGGPPAERDHLAAAGGDRAPARVRLGRGGRRSARRRRGGGHRRARRDLRHRERDADEHLRPQPRDAPGAGPRRRLLAADDEPLPRGARGPAAGRTRPGRERRRGDRRDGRPGGVLLGPDGAARADRARPVRVHDPAVGRHRRRGRRLPRRGLGDDAAAGDPRDRRHPDRCAGDPAGRARRRSERSLGAPRSLGHAPPDRGPRADARDPAPARVAVPPRPLQRPGLDDPAAERPVAGRLRPTRGRVRRGRVRAADARHPDRRAGDERRQPRRALRLLAPPRGGPAGDPRRQPRRRRPAHPPRPVPAPLLRPERAARPVRRDGARVDDEGRPHRVHGLHALRSEPRGRPRPRRRPAIGGRATRAAGGDATSSSAAARRTSPTSLAAWPPTSHGRPSSSSSRPTSCCSCSFGRSSCRPRPSS